MGSMLLSTLLICSLCLTHTFSAGSINRAANSNWQRCQALPLQRPQILHRVLNTRGGSVPLRGRSKDGWLSSKRGRGETQDWMNDIAKFFSKPVVINDIPVTADTLSILIVYFVQGALGIARLAITFFLKDELHLNPAELAALTGIFTIPWVLKPLYGFLSDGVPILGYRRRSYLLLSGVGGALAWVYLSLYAHTASQATAACIVANLGVAISDVVVDSVVVEKARESESQSVAGGLQSLCWGSSAVGGIISAYFSGALLESISARKIFLLTAVLPLLIAFTALTLSEKPLPPQEVSVQKQVSDQVVSLWSAVRQKSVWLPALFIFLWQATPTSESAFFYFLTNDIKIGPEFLGRVRLGSSIASLVGVWVFQIFLRDVRVSAIMFWISIISVPLGFSPLLLIYHINRQIGIPDEVFTFGDDVILTVLGQLAFMPILVLAARVCPPGVEGTLFALLMSIFNGGNIVGSELGALLTKALGVSEADFHNLGTLIVLCNLSSLLPLPFIRWIEEDEEKLAREEAKIAKKGWWRKNRWKRK